MSSNKASTDAESDDFDFDSDFDQSTDDEAWSPAASEYLDIETANVHPDERSPSPAASLSAYPSVPLDCTKHEIRLIYILPSESIYHPIRITLTIHSHDAHPEYEALSYTWGASNEALSVMLNGRSWPVTDHAFAALRQLRRKDSKRAIWIDALCINQTDLEERGQQVGMMTDIYRKAVKVIVWLGDAQEPWIQNQFVSRLPLAKTYEDMLTEDHQLRSFLWAIKKTQPSWWKRVWILQEVVVALSEPSIAFGSYVLTWQDLRKLLNTLKEEHHEFFPNEFVTTLELIQKLKDAYNGGMLSILDAMDLTKSSDATDIRDKAFSLLGIVHRSYELLQPDYTRQPSEVFTNVILASIVETRSFLPLSALVTDSRRSAVCRLDSNGDQNLDPAEWWASDFCSNPRGVSSLEELERLYGKRYVSRLASLPQVVLNADTLQIALSSR